MQQAPTTIDTQGAAAKKIRVGLNIETATLETVNDGWRIIGRFDEMKGIPKSFQYVNIEPSPKPGMIRITLAFPHNENLSFIPNPIGMGDWLKQAYRYEGANGEKHYPELEKSNDTIAVTCKDRGKPYGKLLEGSISKRYFDIPAQDQAAILPILAKLATREAIAEDEYYRQGDRVDPKDNPGTLAKLTEYQNQRDQLGI